MHHQMVTCHRVIFLFLAFFTFTICLYGFHIISAIYSFCGMWWFWHWVSPWHSFGQVLTVWWQWAHAKQCANNQCHSSWASSCCCVLSLPFFSTSRASWPAHGHTVCWGSQATGRLCGVGSFVLSAACRHLDCGRFVYCNAGFREGYRIGIHIVPVALRLHFFNLIYSACSRKSRRFSWSQRNVLWACRSPNFEKHFKVKVVKFVSLINI